MGMAKWWSSCVASADKPADGWNGKTGLNIQSSPVQEQSICTSCVEANSGSKCQCFERQPEELIHDDSGHTVKANSSFTHSVINMVGMLIGLGQLSTPYALENGGWASAFLLVALGVVCAYTTHIIGKCLQQNNKSKDYQDIGEQAFGKTGRLLAATFIYMEIFMALVSYTISLNDNLALVFAGVRLEISWIHMTTSQILTLIAVLIALPSLWLRDLSSISFLSFGGIIMSAIIFTTVLSTALFGGIKANQKIPILNINRIPGISGLYIFSYAGHIVFPNIYKAMKDPSKFTKVSVTSFSIVTVLYTVMAFLGAKLFGPSVSAQVTLSMPPHSHITKVALCATVLTPMTKYALEFAPFAMKLEHSLPSTMSSRFRMIIRGSIGSLLLLIILVLALSVPYFEYVLGLTGSLVSISICIIFPCAFYIRICKHQISTPILLLNGILIVAGASLGVVGTISSSKSLVKSFAQTH